MTCRILLTLLMLLSSFTPSVLYAHEQTITPTELRDAVRKASEKRQKDLSQVRSFFAAPEMKQAITGVGMDFQRVQSAVSTLDADELASLASRTAKVQSDFAAGALSNQELTYIVIALAAAVLVLVVVAA